MSTYPDWNANNPPDPQEPEKPAGEPQVYAERGDASMSTLAATLTAREQFQYLRLVDLKADGALGKNIATYVDESRALTALTVCAASSYGVGKKLMTVTALIYGEPREVSIYRLPEPE